VPTSGSPPSSGDRESTYQWSVETGRTGRFYAEAAKVPGCQAAVSPTTRVLSTGAPGAGEELSFFTPRLFGGKIAHAVSGSYTCSVGWLPGKY
jgi:hypothetical protein